MHKLQALWRLHTCIHRFFCKRNMHSRRKLVQLLLKLIPLSPYPTVPNQKLVDSPTADYSIKFYQPYDSMMMYNSMPFHEKKRSEENERLVKYPFLQTKKIFNATAIVYTFFLHLSIFKRDQRNNLDII